VSIEAARDQYGVVFRPDTFDVDLDSTARRRSEIAGRREAPET